MISLSKTEADGVLNTRCLKAQNVKSPRYRRFLFTKSLKGKEKRRYSVHVFWMEGFRSTDMLSCRDNGPGPPRCVLPAPRPPCSPSLYLPLSRNTRHILLETTPPAKSSLPAPRLFSFTPTLFPRHALTAHLTLKQHLDAPVATGAGKASRWPPVRPTRLARTHF